MESLQTVWAVYLCLSSGAFLNCTSGESRAGCQRLERSSKDVACPKGNEFLRYHMCHCRCSSTDCCILNGILFRTYLISIYNVVVLYRIDFSYCKSHRKSHNSYWESLHCCHLENLQTWSDWGLKPRQMKMFFFFFMPPTVLFN